jgi:hypothetical protein
VHSQRLLQLAVVVELLAGYLRKMAALVVVANQVPFHRVPAGKVIPVELVDTTVAITTVAVEVERHLQVEMDLAPVEEMVERAIFGFQDSPPQLQPHSI